MDLYLEKLAQSKEQSVQQRVIEKLDVNNALNYDDFKGLARPHTKKNFQL